VRVEDRLYYYDSIEHNGVAQQTNATNISNYVNEDFTQNAHYYFYTKQNEVNQETQTTDFQMLWQPCFTLAKHKLGNKKGLEGNPNNDFHSLFEAKKPHKKQLLDTEVIQEGKVSNCNVKTK